MEKRIFSKKEADTVKEIKRFTINLPIEKHRKLKMAATSQDASMTEMLMRCIDRIIQEWEEKKDE